MNRKHIIYQGLAKLIKLLSVIVITFVILFPVYWIFMSSITPAGELFKTPIDYIPNNPTLNSYLYLFENVDLASKIANTILIVGAALLISTIIYFSSLCFCTILFKGNFIGICFYHSNNVDSRSSNSKTTL